MLFIPLWSSILCRAQRHGTALISVGVMLLTACAGDTSKDSAHGPGTTPDTFGNAPMSGAGGLEAFGNPSAGGSGAGMSTGPIAGGPGSRCASGFADTTPVTPTVWLVLDGSGSMNEEFEGSSSRWDVLRSSLMDDDGLVARLERSVRFGMVLYNGIDQERDRDDDDWDNDAAVAPPPTSSQDMCVALVTVDPTLNNYAAIDAQLPDREPGGWTPTDRALEHVVGTLPVIAEAAPDAKNDPIFVILATDGAPNDRCGVDRDQQQGGSDLDPAVAMRVVSAVQNGVQMGMKMFIISLAGDDDELQQHLEEVAAVTGTGLPPFVPSTRADLIDTLQQIVGNATCQIQLDGSVVTGKECLGEVVLNGTALACNSDDGWRLEDEHTVRLTGRACDDFLGAESLVTAEFPCDAFAGPQ